MLGWPNNRALAEAPRMFLCSCFTIVQGHMLGQASSLALAEAPRILLCRLFSHSVRPYAGLGE